MTPDRRMQLIAMNPPKKMHIYIYITELAHGALTPRLRDDLNRKMSDSDHPAILVDKLHLGI